MCLLTVDELRIVFDNLDKNGDGFLCVEELSRLLEMIGHKPSLPELELLTGKPRLDFGEFLLFYESIDSLFKEKSGAQVRVSEEDDDDDDDDLVEAFRVFDLNGDGFISSEELRDVLPRLGFWDESPNGRDCGKMISAYDANRDGRLDFEEFKKMMLNSS